MLCGNNLDRTQGIFDERKCVDLYMPSLEGSIAACVSLPEDVGGSECKSETLLVQVVVQVLHLVLGWVRL